MKSQAQINAHWSESAKNYDDIIQDELSSFRVEGWTEFIKSHVDFKPGMKCLDTGCGPGFFSIILSKAGYKVTAIDGAEKMVETARENCKNNGVDVQVLEMDAHYLDFEDDTFDLVVSRNVTHAIRDHKRVYAEWRRVLKPGGVLLIFDANWHLSWSEPEMREDSKRRYKECIEKYGSDFNGNTSYDEEKFEEVHADVEKHPLAGIRRPDFDFGIMKAVGFDEIVIDRDITHNLWDDKEKLLYGNTPMFMIKGMKGCDHVIEVCMAGCCKRNGAEDLIKTLKERLKIERDDLTTGDGKIKVVESGCLWLCKTPPVISVNGRLYTNVKMSDLDNILETVK